MKAFPSSQIRDCLGRRKNEKSVDRERFYEYSKINYQKIINRLYYAFIDYKKYPKVELSYCWLHFRQELKESGCVSETIGWECMLAK